MYNYKFNYVIRSVQTEKLISHVNSSMRNVMGSFGVRDKIELVWLFIQQESQFLMRNIEHFPNFDEHIELLNEWLLDEGREMKNMHVRIRVTELDEARKSDLIKSLDSLQYQTKRKKIYFLEHRNISYIDWLFELPYLLDEKLDAYGVTSNEPEENKYDFSDRNVVAAIANHNQNYNQEAAYSL